MRFYPGHVVAEALGSRDELEGVRLAAIDRDLRLIPGSAPEIACDTVCLAVGLIPQIELLQILGCRLAFRSERGGFVPEIDDDQRTSLGDVFAPGDVAGVDERHVLAPERAIAAGRRAGAGRGGARSGRSRRPRRRRSSARLRCRPSRRPPAPTTTGGSGSRRRWPRAAGTSSRASARR